MSGDVVTYPTASKFFRAVWLLTTWLPSNRGSRLRVALLRGAGASVGDAVRVGPGVKVLGPKGLTLGDRVGVARDACLDARGGLRIGADTMVGFESVLLSMTHRFDNVDVPVIEQGLEAQPIEIGSGVWIAARVFVLPGVGIGDNSIVGTAAVVTRSLEADVVAAGSPARVLRDR